MSIVSDANSHSAGPSVAETLKDVSIKWAKALMNGMIRAQEARAERFLANHKRGVRSF